MSDPIRTKLKALVEEMLSDRISVAAGNAAYKALTGQECWSGVTRVNVTDMWAAKVTAILAESEPEPCSAAACTSTDHHSTDCPARRPDCEAKAKLPLGHPYSAWVDGEGPCTNTDCAVGVGAARTEAAVKHEHDCGCLTCYQALRKFRDSCKALAAKWEQWNWYGPAAKELLELIAASERQGT